MRAAADGEDGSVKHVAMENRLYPLRELYAELLLEMGQPDRFDGLKRSSDDEDGTCVTIIRLAITENSPDESQTGINVRVFPALLQDRREVLTATSTSVIPTLGRGSDLAISLAFGRTPSVGCS
jgi:hypothetical protein